MNNREHDKKLKKAKARRAKAKEKRARFFNPNWPPIPSKFMTGMTRLDDTSATNNSPPQKLSKTSPPESNTGP